MTRVLFDVLTRIAALEPKSLIQPPMTLTSSIRVPVAIEKCCVLSIRGF
jgi:hypothetical protein